MDDFAAKAQPATGRTLRRFPRYAVDIRVRLIAQKPGNTVGHGRGSELGEGGMGIFIAAELAVGDSVDIEFSVLHSRDPLRATAMVRNRSGYHYGLEFVSLSSEQRRSIVRLCETLVPLKD